MKDYSLRNEKSKLIHATALSLHNHITELFENGYDQGYEDGKKESCDCKDNMDAEYNRGLNDAWEVIQKISSDDSEGGYSCKILVDIFGTSYTCDIVQKYTPQDVIRMIKEYEEQQKQDTIQVGDEVFYMDENDLRVVVRISNQVNVVQITKDGKCAINDVEELHRTGRTFPQIAEVFAEMRGKSE